MMAEQMVQNMQAYVHPYSRRLIQFKKVVIMKKYVLLILILLLGTNTTSLGDFYICKPGECQMFVLENDEGFSWYIVCDDGFRDSKFVRGAKYVGNCENVTV